MFLVLLMCHFDAVICNCLAAEMTQAQLWNIFINRFLYFYFNTILNKTTPCHIYFPNCMKSVYVMSAENIKMLILPMKNHLDSCLYPLRLLNSQS